MSSDFPSINDILSSGKTVKKSDEPPTQAAFTQKMEEIGFKELEKNVAKRAEELNMPYIDLASFPVSAEALKSLSEQEAKDYGVACFYFSSDEIRIGIMDPSVEVLKFVEELSKRFQAHAATYLISSHSFEHVLKLYATLPIVKLVNKDINITDEELNRFEAGINNLKEVQDAFKGVSISDVVTLMIATALKMGASDVHVEAEENGVAVRYRIDGVLHDLAMLPRQQWKQFVSRIKILAALKINVTDRPQDGRVTLHLSKDSLDLRVSTMPTMWGESVVMRILRSGNKGVTFDELGLRGDAFNRLKREVERPNGMIVTTGPTGCGKTTTLYAIIRTLNKPGVKIITLEDPIEIKMEGLNQSQVDPSRDYTFAKGLRSLLRQDPDICMVGEIRDLETAEISIQSALTGHLILSTIHTNSAAGALPRLVSMGVKPFLLAPALNTIVGQRLVRRICENCIEEDLQKGEKLDKAMKLLETLPPAEKPNVDFNNIHFYKGKGCEKCSGLGYKGRIGIYEIFVMTKEIEAVVLGGQVSAHAIEEIAKKDGMVTTAQDGVLKALEKITSLDEVFRVSE
ncbi:MAG: GspE/PulE family protein [Patescibacteria group bacterium]|jgi:type IV pilus assembly protein PilB